MRRNARRWMGDVVSVQRITDSDDVIPGTLVRSETLTESATVIANVRQDSANRDTADGRTFGVRDLIVWLPDGTDVEAGDRITFEQVRHHPDLERQSGHVLVVDRDPYRVIPRATVRMGSDA